MAAPVKPDTEFDRTLDKNLAVFNELRQKVQSFASGFKEMKVQERAQRYQDIQTSFKTIQDFIVSVNIGLVSNTGSKFRFSNLKQKLTSLKGRWRKVEKDLDKF